MLFHCLFDSVIKALSGVFDAGNANLRGRLRTIDLLIEVACFVKK
jgi:hypothetical protein